MKVDGGAVRNNFLMQFQADILGTQVVRPVNIETTAMGAAYLAGLAVGCWKDRNSIIGRQKIDRIFKPGMQKSDREKAYSGWKKAVERSRNWAKDV